MLQICRSVWREKNWEHSGQEGIRKNLLFLNSDHFPLIGDAPEQFKSRYV